MTGPWSLFDEGFIRLTQHVALNDPFEASFCRNSLDELVKHFDETMALDHEYGELSFSQYVDMRMHHIGVISLSENKENLLMWAHYANEHKGIIAGITYYQGLDSIFHNLFRADTYINTSWGEDFSPFNGIPKPVSYRKGLRYRNDKFDYDYSNISVEGADRILYEVFMQKSDEWIYEQEHRVVLRLEQADRVIVDNIDSISNENIKDKIGSSKFATLDSKTGKCIVNLYQIKDESTRLAIAMELVKLSQNPHTIYLMRLKPSCINSCLFGLQSSLKKEDVQSGFATSVGYLDIWKAQKNNDYYSLEFKQI